MEEGGRGMELGMVVVETGRRQQFYSDKSLSYMVQSQELL